MSEANGVDLERDMLPLAWAIVDNLVNRGLLHEMAEQAIASIAPEIIRDVAIQIAVQIEAEREMIRRTGLVCRVIEAMKREGMSLDVIKGVVMVEPKRLFTPRWRRIAWAFRDEIKTELEKQ